MSRKKKLIPNQKRDKLSRIEVSSTQITSGPLPPPDMLNHYNDIDSTFAERIFSMAEKEQDKDITIAKRKVNVGFYITCFGLLCGLMTVAGMLYIAYFAVNNNLEIAIKWIFAPMAGIIAVFVYKKTNKN